jgi:hypothetical protein
VGGVGDEAGARFAVACHDAVEAEPASGGTAGEFDAEGAFARMRRRIAHEDGCADRLRRVDRSIGQPRESRERELERGVHALGRIAAAFRGERPEPGAGLVEALREVPSAGLPVIGLVAVSHDADAHAPRHAAEEVHEVVDAALRVGKLARHARGAVDQDREVHRAVRHAREVALERNEPLGVEIGDLVAPDLARARRSCGDERRSVVPWARLALAIPLAPAVVSARVVA